MGKRKSEPAISFMDKVKEEEDVREEPKSVKKTPRRSVESGFSDFNPFQSGSEDAAERERRRRKARWPTRPYSSQTIADASPPSVSRPKSPHNHDSPSPVST